MEDGDRLAAAADFATALCETREDLATAENLYSEVMQVKQRLHGLRHPHTLVSINNLALLLTAKGEYGKAKPLYVEALRTQRALLGHDHPHTLTSMNNLGNLMADLGEADLAKALLKDCIDARRRVLGPLHPGGRPFSAPVWFYVATIYANLLL